MATYTTPDLLDQLTNAREPCVPMPEGTQRVITSRMHVCFSPLVLGGPCVLRAIAITDKVEARGLGLQVQQQSGEVAAQFVAADVLAV